MVVDERRPSLIARGLVDAVVVGADRIAANGDVANKVGTYPLRSPPRAPASRSSSPPPSRPSTTTPRRRRIEIEERDPAEVTPGPAFNPAFDVTPHDLVTAVVTERRSRPTVRRRQSFDQWDPARRGRRAAL